MTAKPIKNIGASVRRRLLNKAREEGRGLQGVDAILCHGAVSVSFVDISVC